MRYANAAVKQSDIETVLECFRAEICLELASLSRELREVLEHIHSNIFSLDLNVKAIKRSCRIRDNNISSRFRYEIGVTMRDYIESLRIEAASRLLEKGVPVFDAAMSVGYDHPQTFYRAFHRKFDCTPAMLHRNEEAEGGS